MEERPGCLVSDFLALPDVREHEKEGAGASEDIHRTKRKTQN